MKLICLIVAIVLFAVSAFPMSAENKWRGSLVPLGLAFFAGSFIIDN